MERFLSDWLYLLIFVAIIVVNFIRQRWARRREQLERAAAAVQAARPPQTAESPPAEDVPSAEEWGRRPGAAPRDVSIAVPAPRPAAARAEPAVTRRHPLRTLLSDRYELRRAVVLSMVLGPCGGQQPQDDHAARSARRRL